MHVLVYVFDRYAKIVIAKSALLISKAVLSAWHRNVYDPLQDTKSRNSKAIHIVRVEWFHEAPSELVRGIMASLIGIAE